MHVLRRVMGAVATSSESHASAALQVRRVQQIAQGQRPHAVGTQKSVVSPARFAAWGWVGFQRENHGLLARFAATMVKLKRGGLHMNLMAGKAALPEQLPVRINDLLRSREPLLRGVPPCYLAGLAA